MTVEAIQRGALLPLIVFLVLVLGPQSVPAETVVLFNGQIISIGSSSETGESESGELRAGEAGIISASQPMMAMGESIGGTPIVEWPGTTDYTVEFKLQAGTTFGATEPYPGATIDFVQSAFNAWPTGGCEQTRVDFKLSTTPANLANPHENQILYVEDECPFAPCTAIVDLTGDAFGNISNAKIKLYKYDGAGQQIYRSHLPEPGKFWVYQELMHEITHLLGMQHSTDPTSISFPVQPGGGGAFQPNSNDIQACLEKLEPGVGTNFTPSFIKTPAEDQTVCTKLRVGLEEAFEPYILVPFASIGTPNPATQLHLSAFTSGLLESRFVAPADILVLELWNLSFGWSGVLDENAEADFCIYLPSFLNSIPNLHLYFHPLTQGNGPNNFYSTSNDLSTAFDIHISSEPNSLSASSAEGLKARADEGVELTETVQKVGQAQ